MKHCPHLELIVDGKVLRRFPRKQDREAFLWEDEKVYVCA